MTKSTGKRRRRRYWTEEELEQLRALYPDTPTAEIARITGRLIGTVYQKALSIGLHKSPAYLASTAACRLRQGDNVVCLETINRRFQGHGDAEDCKPCA